MKYTFVLVFFISFFLNNFSQDDRAKTIQYLKQYNLLESSNSLVNLKESLAKKVFQLEIDYLKNGNNKFFEPNGFQADYIDSVVYNNYLGDYYKRRLFKNDSLTFVHYLKAFKIARDKEDTILINESLIRINWFFLNQKRDIIIFNEDSLTSKRYLNKLNKYKTDKIDRFYSKYFNLFYKLTFDNITNNELKKIEKEYLELLKQTPNINYHQGLVKQAIGLFYVELKNNKLSRKYFEETLSTYNKDFYSDSRKITTEINLALCDYDDKNYKKAINGLKNTLKNNRINHDSLRLEYIIYDWLFKSSSKLKSRDSVDYFIKKTKLEKKINSSKTKQKIKLIDTKFKTKETKKQLNSISKINKTLKSQMNTILPILAIITLLLGFVYILYKKYYKKSENLEEEKSETIKKIDELKQIVIKNHIVLKDKTKVYIADLTYIKSDDHYLKVFLSNGKNHFVRGKLNKIVEELPPNFIRCHRSYVVNRNFIKQINNTNIILVDKTELPLSRSYKDKL